jgi:hypothetical protein
MLLVLLWKCTVHANTHLGFNPLNITLIRFSILHP